MEATLGGDSAALDAVSDPGCINIKEATTKIAIPLPKWISDKPLTALISTNYKLRMSAECSGTSGEVTAKFGFDGDLQFGADIDVVGS